MESQNIDTKRTNRAFTPSKLELIALPIFSLLFLTGSNAFTYFRTVDDVNYLVVTDYMQARFRSALGTIDELLGPTALTVLFWMVVGLVVYVIAWLIYTTYTAYKNDIPVTRGMVVPKEYNQSKVLHESIARFLVRLIATILFVVWMYTFFAEILPYASRTYLAAITSFSLSSLGMIVWSVLLLSASVFSFFLLVRCIVLRDRVFS